MRADLGALAASPVRLFRRMRGRRRAVAAPPELLHRCFRILQGRLVLLETAQERRHHKTQACWTACASLAQSWNRVLTFKRTALEDLSAPQHSGPTTTSERERSLYLIAVFCLAGVAM